MLNGKLFGAILPLDLFYSTYNINPNIQKKDKRSIKPFVKEIGEIEHVTKIIISYLPVKV